MSNECPFRPTKKPSHRTLPYCFSPSPYSKAQLRNTSPPPRRTGYVPTHSLLPSHSLTPELDAIIYAVSGHGVLLTSPPDDDLLPVPGRSSRGTTSEADPTSSDGRTHHQEARRNPLAPGDFAVIPPWTEHQMVNEGGAEDGDVVWLVVRSGEAPVEVDLVDWGGDRIEDGKGR